MIGDSRTERARLRVDPLACQGVGVCAHVAPKVVRLDSWGFPVLAAITGSERAKRQASAAMAACPRRALFLEGT